MVWHRIGNKPAPKPIKIKIFGFIWRRTKELMKVNFVVADGAVPVRRQAWCQGIFMDIRINVLRFLITNEMDYLRHTVWQIGSELKRW